MSGWERTADERENGCRCLKEAKPTYPRGRQMYFALYNGGPTALLFSFVLVFSGALVQSSSLGEMASIASIADARYHYTYRQVPPRVRRFATRVQAWSRWSGHLALLAGMVNVTIIQLNHKDYTSGGWRSSVLVIARFISFGLVNISSRRGLRS
ncbi:hypothetical protein DL765_006462 [Monosporascus sp. GIB2]|nr:hypothetical protein DL765_006462 [Monosporascus sp. GIB2]